MQKNNIIADSISWIFLFFTFLQEQHFSAKIDLYQLTILKVKCETEAEIRRLCQEVEQKKEIIQQLRHQLEEQGDYKELQHQAR